MILKIKKAKCLFLYISEHEVEEETVWVEGLVPGIDFCNHGIFH